MANVKKNGINRHYYGGTPYGNSTLHAFSFETDADGVFVDSSQDSAVQIDDVVKIGVLPAGTQLIDSLSVVSDAFTASATADVGFAYVDGVDDADVPEDADYFNAALAINTEGRTVAGNVAVVPVILPKDAYLTLTMAGAALAEVGKLDVIVSGIWTGLPSANP